MNELNLVERRRPPLRRELYPDDWDDIAKDVRAATGWKCQACGKQCYMPGAKVSDTRFVPTVAHVRFVICGTMRNDGGGNGWQVNESRARPRTSCFVRNNLFVSAIIASTPMISG